MKFQIHIAEHKGKSGFAVVAFEGGRKVATVFTPTMSGVEDVRKNLKAGVKYSPAILGDVVLCKPI